MPLVVMIRDPDEWPPPHSADVALSEVGNFAAHGGWVLADPGNGRDPVIPDPVGGHIALLCGGPSLHQHWPDKSRAFKCVIGINRAGATLPVDWWFGLDGPVWAMFPGALVPRVGYAGCVGYLLGRSGDGMAAGRQLVEVHDAPGCQAFSGCAAVHYAFEVLKASKLTVYGVDLSGNLGCDGHPGSDQTGTRWPDEIASWDILRKRYGKRMQFVGGRYGSK